MTEPEAPSISLDAANGAHPATADVAARLELLEHRVADLQLNVETLLCRQVVPLDEGFMALRSRIGWLVVGQEEFRSVLHLADGSSIHEPVTAAVLERLVEPGDWVLDVGAHIGLLSLPMAQAVGPQGRLIAVEPNPRSAEALRRTLSANGLIDRCDIHLVAASDADGSATFYEGANSMLGSLTPDDSAPQREVGTRMIDTIVPSPRRVSAVKIDAEGAELVVLGGMRRVIADNPDIVVIAEFGPTHLKRNDQTKEQWLGAFAEAGLTECFVIDETSMLCSPLAEIDITQLYSSNLIFMRTGNRKADRLTDPQSGTTATSPAS